MKEDGQLNIPENSNGIPDILDEAWWALKLWNQMQDKDGGVRCKIESHGDPRTFDSAATDSLREFAYRKSAKASYRYAAVATQASLIWKKLEKKTISDDLLKRALKAWDWARKNGKKRESDFHVFAAAMLLKATGEKRFDEAFKRYSVYSKKPNSPPMQYNKYDQMWGSFYYAKLPQANPVLKKRIIKSFEKLYFGWLKAAETTAYRYMRSPYAPNNWGTGGLPKHSIFPAMTGNISENPIIKKSVSKWIGLSNDFSLGCHPMNLVFTVGLGQRHVNSAWHHLMIHSPAGIIPGLMTEAAGGRFISGGRGSRSMSKWPGISMFPSGQWPDLYKYSENASPGMNEGVSGTQVKVIFSYGLKL